MGHPQAPVFLDALRILESISDAFIVVDRDWHILYANFQAAQINGKPTEAFLGKTIWDEWPGLVGTGFEKSYRQAVHENVTVEFEQRYADEVHDVWLHVRAHPIPEGLIIWYNDISERKRAERTIALSDRRFRLAIEQAPVVVFEQDRDLRYTWIYNSPSVYAPELSLGRTDREIMPNAYGEQLMQLKQQVIEGGRGARTEVAVVFPDGSIYYDVALEPLRNELGEITGLTGAAFEITDRKRAEETLLAVSLLGSQIGAVLAGNAQLEEMLDQCADLLMKGLDAAFVRIWLFKESADVLQLAVSKGQYTYRNEPHNKIAIGDTKIGRIARDRRPHLTNAVLEDAEIDREWARQEGILAFAGYPLFVGERLEGVLALFARKPLNEAVHLSLSSISDSIATAIERTRSERELRALQDRTGQVLNAITDAFFALDRDWLVTYANRRFEEITRRSFDELKGKEFWQEFPETLGTEYERNYREASLTGTSRLFEAYFPPLALWTEVHVYPSEQGLSIYFQDISERKRLEQKLLDAAKLESLGVMAGGIAHDFNNLLTGILGNASLLAELPEAADRQLAEDIMKAAERAADLTRQMLAYSGKGRFEVRAVDLSSEIEEILRLVRPMIDKNVEIDLHLAEALPCIEADPGQMQQMIMNLVINAAESMGGARGRVTITTGIIDVDELFIAQTHSNHELTTGNHVSLEIQDTGCGMSEETKAKIFDPFFTTKFTGRGLGLAAVSGIVRGHKGALRVYSSPGQGTTFRVFLPAAEGKQVSAGAVPASEPRQEGLGTILLVDDEEIVRRVGRTSLERLGFEVLMASNGAEAVEVFEATEKQIVLVILDVTMPVMGGAEALAHLQRIRPEIPVIMSSGYNDTEVIQRFTNQGVAGFVQKPYTSFALTGKVKAVLKERGLAKSA